MKDHKLKIIGAVVVCATIGVIVLVCTIMRDMDDNSQRLRELKVKASKTNVTAFDLAKTVMGPDTGNEELKHEKAWTEYHKGESFDKQKDWYKAAGCYSAFIIGLRKDRAQGITDIRDYVSEGAAHGAIARDMIQTHHFKEALPYINSAIACDNTNWRYYEVRADIYDGLGRVREAADERRKMEGYHTHPPSNPTSEFMETMFGYDNSKLSP